MGLACSALIDEVQANTGRDGDTVLVSDARVTQWLNNGQVWVATNAPGLRDLDFNDTTSIACVSDDITYALADISYIRVDASSANGVMYIDDLYFLNGSNSKLLDFMPVDEFDRQYMDPTSTDFDAAEPEYWTRRGDNIEILPRPSSVETGKYLKVVGQKYPAEITGTSTSDLKFADEGLIYYATSKAWAAIGKDQESSIWWARFSSWFNNYSDTNRRMMAWDDSVLFDQL